MDLVGNAICIGIVSYTGLSSLSSTYTCTYTCTVIHTAIYTVIYEIKYERIADIVSVESQKKTKNKKKKKLTRKQPHVIYRFSLSTCIVIIIPPLSPHSPIAVDATTITITTTITTTTITTTTAAGC